MKPKRAKTKSRAPALAPAPAQLLLPIRPAAPATLGAEFARILTPPERLTVYDWAGKYMRLAPPITKTGPFDVSASRHFIAIFDTWQDDRVREVNVLKPVRGGGSLIGDVICCYGLSEDPGPYMEVFQTEPEAKLYAETRSQVNFKNCARIRELFPADRHKHRDNEILFSHGHTWYNVGPATGNLQTKSIRYLRLEEVWMWEQGKMGEAMGRIGDYLKIQTSKVLTISQGGPRPGFDEPMENSDWYRHYHRAQLHEWEVECSACHKYFTPIFSGVRADGSFWGMTWNKYSTAAGDWDVAKCLPTLRFECEHCAHPILDGSRTKSEWNRTGRYRALGEENPKRKSFHWETVIDFPWDELVGLWLEACNAEKRGDLSPKLQFYQKRRAMFRDEESLLKGALHITRTSYDVASDWPDERARFLTVDRQEEDLYWVSVRAWSAATSRRLHFGKCYGVAALEQLRLQFKVAPNHTFIDSRFMPKGDHGVYAACCKFGWIAVMGAKEYSFTHRTKTGRFVRKSYAPVTYGDPASGISSARRRCPVIRFSKTQMNQKVQELIDSGAWEEPVTGDAELEAEYNAQMSSRVKRTEFDRKTNETRVYWREGKNDHARDLANHQVLGAILSDLVPDPCVELQSKSEKEIKT